MLNVDVSALQNPSMAGFGGVVCNFEGRFILGFYGPSHRNPCSVAWVGILLECGD